MCAVSAVGDIWTDKFKKSGVPDWFSYQPGIAATPAISIHEYAARIAALEVQIKEMREELRAARQQDIENNEPDCEMEEKVVLLKKIADLVGVDLGDVFPNG